jgi:hypothetical protein
LLRLCWPNEITAFVSAAHGAQAEESGEHNFKAAPLGSGRIEYNLYETSSSWFRFAFS